MDILIFYDISLWILFVSRFTTMRLDMVKDGDLMTQLIARSCVLISLTDR